jgi:hypothetical protein
VTNPKQLSLFDVEDLPLFSGTPQRAEAGDFTPAVKPQQAGMFACGACRDTGQVGEQYCTCDAGQQAAAQAKANQACVCGEPATEDYEGYRLCAGCAERAAAYQGRVEDRIEALHARADRKAQGARADLDRAHEMASAIPFGQPILVGHHSEKRDRRYRARIHNLHRRGFEGLEDAKTLRRRAEAAENNDAISSDDPLAALKLEARIEARSRWQEHMKAANKLVRKNAKAGEEAQVAALVEFGYEEAQASALVQPDFAGRAGYPGYMLSNNNANIRRMKQRVEQLRAKAGRKAEQGTTEEEALPGLVVVRNVEINRLQLIFDAKPSAEVRDVLKADGWRWARSQGAWQRHLNNRSEWTLERTLETIRALD